MLRTLLFLSPEKSVDSHSESLADNLYLSGEAWLAAVTNIPQNTEITKV